MKLFRCVYLMICVCCVFYGVSVAAAERVQVIVSIPPQTYFVEQVGGELVEVAGMLPPGAFPHTFEPTARQMKMLSRADLYVRIQVEFEQTWWERMAAMNPTMHVIDSTEGIEAVTSDAHHYHHEGEAVHKEDTTGHDERGRDPHVWLSPAAVKIQTEAICRGLSAVDARHADVYRANKDRFLAQLDALDTELQQIFAESENRTFMVFHPSWAYFARDYGLREISIELEGKEPSAAEMTQLMKLASAEKIRVIFVQPQTSRRSAEIIARQIGAEVKILDPLSADWMENMRRVAHSLAASLQ